MSTLVPSASSCHILRLPPTEKDDRLNLNVRTGSASTLYKSLIFTYGGLTIGLDIAEEGVEEVIQIFRLKISNIKSGLIDRYVSGEFFYLDLIEKYWTRVEIPSGELKPKPRLFHEVTAVNNCVYVFGGLVVNEKYDSYTHEGSNERELVACNELWEFSLETRKWSLLHDGSNYEFDATIPRPRFSHKMTTLSSLLFVNKKDHFGIVIAGGRDNESRSLYDNFVFDLVKKEYVGSSPIELTVDTNKTNERFGNINSIVTSEDYKINVDYVNNVIISFIKEPTHHHRSRTGSTNKAILSDYTSTTEGDESLIVYSQVDSSQDQSINPLLSFKVGKSIKEGRILPVHNKVLTRENSTLENENRRIKNHFIPYNLKFPTGGLFGQNIVITGFLPNDNDISIFIYNKPTGKWSRLNFFCDHDYGSHRCWGGYAWQSHHKVVLLGNYLTSRTSSSMRFFTLMITVSLPITNILASLELEGGHYHSADGTKVFYKDDNSSTDDNNRDRLSDEEADYSSSDALSDGEKKIRDGLKRRPSVSASTDKVPQSISFSEYVHYVAPKTKFTTIRSVFPPAAITLGRNAMDRYGDLISDFEFVSSNGDRIPVSLRILMERWGRYFIQLLAKGYVHAVDRFERDQQLDKEATRNTSVSSESKNSTSKTHNKLRSSMSTGGGSSISSNNSEISVNQSSSSKKAHQPASYHVAIPTPSKYSKEPPQFRLPFQELLLATDANSDKEKSETNNQALGKTSKTEKLPVLSDLSSIADEQHDASRKESVSSFSSNNSLLNSHLQNIPPQLPLPNEPIPAVPASTSFRSSSRKNSADLSSPRASLMYTLTALRNIPPTKSPRESPFSSPRASVSGPGSVSIGNELLSSAIPNLRQGSLSAERSTNRLSRSLDSSPSNSTEALPIRNAANESITDHSAGNKKVSSDSSTSSQESFSQDRKFFPLTSIHPNTNKGFSHSEGNQNYEETNAKESNDSLFNNPLLDFENAESGKFRMEPSLIPRKLYMPFGTSSIKAFCEYLYTGQVGNKWLLSPVTLDNLAISKFLDVPLLYDLISEVLFGVIGRKESFIIREGNKMKRRYNDLLKLTDSVPDSNFSFPLDEYEGFMDTIDDGFLDITLLKKSSASHKDSSASAMSSKKHKLSLNSASSFRYSISIDDINENAMSLKEVPLDETLASSSIKHNQEKNISDDIKEELTDNSIEKSTSNSEEDNDFELGYLDARDNLSLNVGPRAKSIFDKSGTDMKFQSVLDNNQKEKESEIEKSKSLNLTLEQLVSPQSPLPSDYTIDLIYETATLCRDIKLMLRAANVKNMSDVFNQSKLELNTAIDELENKYEQQQKQQKEPQKVDSTPQKGKIPIQLPGAESDAGLEHIKSNMSSSSLSTLGLKSGDLEKTKSNTGFRNIGGFGPFKAKPDLKASKTAAFENNKELDRRITRLIKNDEKLKLKTAKDEKLKRLQDQKLEKRQTQTDKPKLTTRKSLFAKYKDEGSTSTLASEASTSKKKHGFLHNLGHHKKKNEPLQGDDSLLESSTLSRTLSASGSISSANSKKSQGLKIKNGLFGKKRISN